MQLGAREGPDAVPGRVRPAGAGPAHRRVLQPDRDAALQLAGIDVHTGCLVALGEESAGRDGDPAVTARGDPEPEAGAEVGRRHCVANDYVLGDQARAGAPLAGHEDRRHSAALDEEPVRGDLRPVVAGEPPPARAVWAPEAVAQQAVLDLERRGVVQAGRADEHLRFEVGGEGGAAHHRPRPVEHRQASAEGSLLVRSGALDEAPVHAERRAVVRDDPVVDGAAHRHALQLQRCPRPAHVRPGPLPSQLQVASTDGRLAGNDQRRDVEVVAGPRREDPHPLDAGAPDGEVAIYGDGSAVAARPDHEHRAGGRGRRRVPEASERRGPRPVPFPRAGKRVDPGPLDLVRHLREVALGTRIADGLAVLAAQQRHPSLGALLGRLGRAAERVGLQPGRGFTGEDRLRDPPLGAGPVGQPRQLGAAGRVVSLQALREHRRGGRLRRGQVEPGHAPIGRRCVPAPRVGGRVRTGSGPAVFAAGQPRHRQESQAQAGYTSGENPRRIVFSVTVRGSRNCSR